MKESNNNENNKNRKKPSGWIKKRRRRRESPWSHCSFIHFSGIRIRTRNETRLDFLYPYIFPFRPFNPAALCDSTLAMPSHHILSIPTINTQSVGICSYIYIWCFLFCRQPAARKIYQRHRQHDTQSHRIAFYIIVWMMVMTTIAMPAPYKYYNTRISWRGKF